MSFNVWQPQGAVISHSSTTIYPANPNVLYEGTSQLGLSGTVFKMWYCNIQTPFGIYYAESSDGVSWTQDSGNPIISSGYYPKVFKNGGTYYLYCNSSANANVRAYTSTDGVTWTLQNATALTPTQSWENSAVYQLCVAGIDSRGTWWGYYSGGNANNSGYLEGQATSTDGVNWTKNPSNPVASMSSGTLSSGASWLGSSNFAFEKVGNTYYGWSQIQLINCPGAPGPGVSGYAN